MTVANKQEEDASKISTMELVKPANVALKANKERYPKRTFVSHNEIAVEEETEKTRLGSLHLERQPVDIKTSVDDTRRIDITRHSSGW